MLPLSPFFPWWSVFKNSVQRKAATVVYPKKRLTVQHSKHSWFFTQGQNQSQLYCCSALMWDFEPWRTYNIIYSQNQGWSVPVQPARPALCPTDSQRLDFSQAVEESLNGLIASRLREMDIWITLSEILLHVDLINWRMNSIWRWFYTLHFTHQTFTLIPGHLRCRRHVVSCCEYTSSARVLSS